MLTITDLRDLTQGDTAKTEAVDEALQAHAAHQRVAKVVQTAFLRPKSGIFLS